MSSRKVRILSLLDEIRFGGDENRLLTLARTIDNDRFDLRVVTFKQPSLELDAYYGSMREQYANAGIAVQSFNEGHPNHGLAPSSALRQLRRSQMFRRTLGRICHFIRSERIDVVDGHGGPGNLIGVVAAAICRRPCLVTTYNVEQWQPRWLWHPVHQSTLGLATTIVTDSDAVADAVRHFMIAAKRIEVIPNGVIPPSSSRTNDEMRVTFGLPRDPGIRIVGQISSLFATKGQMVLIDAMPAILEECPNTAFLMVGYTRDDPTYADRLRERARELGVAQHVRIVAYPGPIGDVWSVIDVQAHPTLLDSLPNAIIEGMSLRKPAVVTNVGGISTMVEDGTTGLVVAPASAEKLADAIVRLLKDAPLAQRLGMNARARYEQGYTPQHMTRRLERLFLELAA